jgi:broad specificity phosphatase PhoE
MGELVLARHGATEWSRNGRHTGRTDLPLLDDGRRDAERLRGPLAERTFAKVLSSPLSRALDTCKLAGLGDQVELTENLLEWDYGEYEGVTTVDIRKERPGWNLWTDGCPGGESSADVGARMDELIDELIETDGDIALFGHGHALRVLATRWIGLPPENGALFVLSTGTLSVLGSEHEWHAFRSWNGPVPESS